MTCQDAVSKVIKILTVITIDEETEESSQVTNLPVFPYSRKKDFTGELIVVNTLGFPHEILQVGFVNVNIHIPDKLGLINNKRLYEVGNAVIAGLNAYNPLSDTDYIDLELVNEQVFQGGNEDHYLSLKYKVAMLN